MKKKLFSVFLLTLMAIALTGLTALAIDDPDSTPSIEDVKVNCYLLEEGDMLIYGEYDIPYASPPTETATDAYIFRLLDGENELGINVAFSLMDNGYNEGCFSFYFTAEDAPTWGESYTIRVSQNPAVFTDNQTYWDFVIPESAYTSYTTQEQNQWQLAINILNIAEMLNTAHSDYSFTDTSAGGTVLSSPTGETYFRGAIYGIQAMAPSLFLVQRLSIETTKEYGTEQFETYQERFSGTWVGATENTTEEELGVSHTSFMALIVGLPLTVGGVVLSAMKFKKVEPGYVVAFLFLIMLAVMGWMDTALFATLFQVSAIYLAYVIFYARG